MGGKCGCLASYTSSMGTFSDPQVRFFFFLSFFLVGHFLLPAHDSLFGLADDDDDDNT